MVNYRKKNLPKNLIAAIIVSFILITVISLSFIFKPKGIAIPDNISLFIKNKGYFLETAKTKETRQKGLSDRNELCNNCGMLFIFEKEGDYSFWMKDTHIPLDMIWINSQNQVVKIVTALKTDSEDYIISQKPAKYVIELNANESFKLNLKIGDTIEIPKFDD